MIVMALANPLAFVLAIGAGMGYGYVMYGSNVETYPDNDWKALVVMLVAYVLGMRFLPWWVRPIQLYRWWQQK